MGVTINASVDSGYGYSLGCSPMKEVIISNFIKKISQDDAKRIAENITIVNEDNVLIKYDGTYYAVGKLAVKADPKITRGASNDRVNDIEHHIELLATLGLLCDNRNYDVNLVVGLPNKLRYDKKNMAKWLKKTFDFAYLNSQEEVYKEVNIKNVACIEQPIAAVYNLTDEQREVCNIISLDIGHNTTDGIYMSEGVVSVNANDWLNLDGVRWCYNELEKRLVAKYFDSEYKIVSVLERDLQIAIETGIFKFHNKKENIDSILNDIFNDYADLIFKEVENRYSQYFTTTDYVIASGGIMSNNAFAEKLSKKFKFYGITFAIFPNPQKSIVNGMFNIANQLYEDDFTNTNVAGKEVASDEEPTN
jgi:plasmid segregation protein ParM